MDLSQQKAEWREREREVVAANLSVYDDPSLIGPPFSPTQMEIQFIFVSSKRHMTDCACHFSILSISRHYTLLTYTVVIVDKNHYTFVSKGPSRK